MNKTLATVIAAGMTVFGASAAELDLLPMYSPELCWSGASMTDNTITWTEGWGGLVFNLENKDYSAYNYVVLDFAEPTSVKTKLEAYYAAEETAGTAAEADASSTTVIMKLDESKKADIAKIALMAAKASTATLTKAVLVDELETDPVLFEGSIEVPDMKKIYFKLGADKFIGLKAGQVLTVYFTTGDLQQYASVDFYSNNKKLECQNGRTNTKKDGQFALDATETSTVISSESDIASLQSYGLQIKGRNVTITKVTLTDGMPENPDDPDTPDVPDTPADGFLWSGSVATGTWANDVTVDAAKLAQIKGGDIITVYLSVDEGKDFGNIELDDMNYSKLATDGTGVGLDSYGCVQPGVTEIAYTITNNDATLLKANGLRVKGANITITGIKLTVGEALPDDPEPTDQTTLWTGSVNCGQWKETILVPADKWATAKAGDKFRVYLSINQGKGKGIVKVQSGDGVDLSVNNKGTNMDSSGNFVRGAGEATYEITDADLPLLKASGLLISGFAITVTKVDLLITENITDGVNEVESDLSDAPVEYYNLQGVRVAEPATGMFIKRQGNKVTKVYLR
ncbi:MAG: hypothetical protein K2M12_06015 [Muribaculaceae bacterium]|nr:hypothetical protein [Muribaculaceae bacterium]